MAFQFHVSSRPARFVCAAWLGLVLAGGAGAQVKLDGSLGGAALNLTGPNFQILPTYGRQVGRNLFHSFSDFNLVPGDVARFSGPPEIRNVLARVTGGSVSSIDGTIQSAIPGANFFLMNPAGIVFGPNAAIDVSGAFTATTADYIRLADGGRFPAGVAERPILTSADPRAFGFLPSRTDPPAAPPPIVVNGAKLNVPYPSLSLIAGAVTESGDAAVTSDYGVVRKIETGAGAGGIREVNAVTGGLAPPPFITPGSVVLDGTLGSARGLAGPVYRIDPELGRQQGGNLFQSFSDFQINAGEVAIFSGPASVQNLLVRVTGVNASAINGALKSEIPGVNLFFLNPRGISFGANSSLAIDGSFLATTADYLRFRDGSIFPARPLESTASLSGETVMGVGFLAGEVAARGRNAPLTVDNQGPDGSGPGPDLLVAAAQSLWLVGGELTVDQRQLAAPGGAVALLALNSAGEVALNFAAPRAAIRTDHFAEHAPLTLRNEAAIDVGGPRAGRATLRGSDVFLDASAAVQAATRDTDSDVAIDVKATRRLELSNSSGLSTAVSGAGRGGDVELEAQQVTLSGFATISSGTYGGTTGNGGNIFVRAQNVTLSGNSSINLSGGGSGIGGRIDIRARDTIALNLDENGGGEISAISFDTAGGAGGIHLESRRLVVGFNSRLATESESGVPGGNLVIKTSLLRVAGGLISATSNGGGDGGAISIAADRIELDGANNEQFSGIRSGTGNTLAPSRGGSIELLRGDSGRGELSLNHGAKITTSSVSLGAAGDIRVDLDKIFLGRDAVIASSSENTGNGGSIILRATDSIRLTDHASLAVTATSSRAGSILLQAGRDVRLEHARLNATSPLDGGSITLKAGNLVLLEQTQISASAGFDGGNILIDPPLVVLRGATVTADSAAANAGFITVVADSFLLSDSLVRATTPNKTAFQGQVEVVAPDSDLAGRLVPLAGVFLRADSRLLEDCARAALGLGSSFILRGRGGLGAGP